ncbi:MAG TPA: hypothetical protein PLD27_11885 [bacterium]|nr:hypothetical protein [bacterium]HOL48660.1 hypothetical protein [bacterium]HPQ20151.1 hypothetical protein [bacterium]
MKEFFSIIILSIIVEKCVGIIKDFRKKKLSPSIIRFCSLVLGIILTIITKLGILRVLNILARQDSIIVEYIDYIITGIIISRGSNVVHDLFSLLEKINKNMTQK